MRPHEFYRMSRPERDAMEFIQKRAGEMSTVWTTPIQLMAAQMARDIRSAVDSEVEYGDALEQAKDRWSWILS